MRLGLGGPPLSRRDILRCLAAAAAIGAAPATGDEKRKIGLQLYTVRDLLKSDFEGTLRKVVRLGYREVEFADIIGPDVRRTSALLRSPGLAAPSLHLDYIDLRDKTASSFDIAHSLGSRFVVCPWLDPPQRQTIDAAQHRDQHRLPSQSALFFSPHVIVPAMAGTIC
ncbi:hypothetical protein QA640_05160 [Bradyrhizobium sp. CB82]|uniref:sugar phosphate isomerase/epimerase family protein n=1 Tax=Bradyrhizobium sp. CB82 TaxID=3039159 RepID=UPI0024B0D7F5|nr:hypothetical protein [Bradyrhizobium sp. CB82]WFU41888.1 hypothetical protein QA640_05160 [Bradyrhizobium sp. CB82]